jgi:hypothetical protein
MLNPERGEVPGENGIRQPVNSPVMALEQVSLRERLRGSVTNFAGTVGDSEQHLPLLAGQPALEHVLEVLQAAALALLDRSAEQVMQG